MSKMSIKRIGESPKGTEQDGDWVERESRCPSLAWVNQWHGFPMNFTNISYIKGFKSVSSGWFTKSWKSEKQGKYTFSLILA